VARRRRLQASAGLLLACTFFLPAVRSCNSNIIPAESVVELAGDPPTDFDEWLHVPSAFALYLAAYVFGAVTFITLLRHPPTRTTSGGYATAILLCLTPICALAVWLELITSSMSGGFSSAGVPHPVVLLAAWTFVCCARCWRRAAGGAIAIRWYTALCCVLWFAWWTCDGALIGVHLALAASAAILVGAYEEARLRAHRGPFRTLLALTIASLELPDPTEPQCTRCGYLLLGLTTPRCPECGTPFEPDRLTSPATATP